MTHIFVLFRIDGDSILAIFPGGLPGLRKTSVLMHFEQRASASNLRCNNSRLLPGPKCSF